MMKQNTQFLYFLVNIGNENLLKTEIAMKYPFLNFAFSSKGFCTFKNTNTELSLEEIGNLDICFSRCWGEYLYKGNYTDTLNIIKKIKENPPYDFAYEYHTFSLTQTSFSYKKNTLLDKNIHTTVDTNTLLVINKTQASIVIELIEVAQDLFFLGQRFQDKWGSLSGRTFLDKINYDENEKHIPSRAYYKIKEAFILTKKFYNNALIKNAIEFGSAPGGATLFLLENGYNVTGIDPAEMDTNILQNSNFNFIKKPIQFVSPKDVSQNNDVLIVDVNLNPKFVLNECLRLKDSNWKYAYITLKFNDPKLIKRIPEYQKLIKKIGFKNIHFLQLPFHKKEILAFCTK